MKIGICLIGISYSTGMRSQDFRTTCPNFHGTIFIPLVDQQHEVKLYTTTYENSLHDILLLMYRPHKSQFLPYANSHSRTTYIEGLKLAENEDLDVIISTRFDIIFSKKITDLDIDYSKFNFLFGEGHLWTSRQFVTDNFFVFPKKFLSSFIEAIQMAHRDPEYQNCTFMLHNVDKPLSNLLGDETLHFISPKLEESGKNSFYKLERTFL